MLKSLKIQKPFLLDLVQMNRFKTTFLPLSPEKRRNHDDTEPEVWKYLDDSSQASDAQKRAKRLENARKFLKIAQNQREECISVSKNKFEVIDLTDIELPPTPPKSAGPPPPGVGPPSQKEPPCGSNPIHLPPLPVSPTIMNPPLPPPHTESASTPHYPSAQSESSPGPAPPSRRAPLGSLELEQRESRREPAPPSRRAPLGSLHWEQRESERVVLRRQDGTVQQITSRSRTVEFSTTAAHAPPPANRLQAVRQWVHNSPPEDPGGMYVRFLSYNVLAQNLLTSNPQLYRGMDPTHLNWEYRWRGIQQEVSSLNPDIVCLQEVQFRYPNYFRSHYLPFFEGLGYRAVFMSRTGDKQDGCAIFYKLIKFKLEKYSLIKYLHPGVSILDRDNVGVICQLVPRGREDLPRLVVGTTHLLFNKKRTDIRLAQMAVFLAELDDLSYCDGKYLPVIISGDFNSSTESEVYRLVRTGRVDYAGLPAGRIRMTDQLIPAKVGIADTCQKQEVLHQRQEAPVFGTGSFSHLFTFTSIYEEWEQPGDTNKVVSTNHGDWTIVDFVFYSSGAGALNLRSRLLLPRKQDMGLVGRIPSDVCPSDHFPLIADFVLRPPS